MRGWFWAACPSISAVRYRVPSMILQPYLVGRYVAQVANGSWVLRVLEKHPKGPAAVLRMGILVPHGWCVMQPSSPLPIPRHMSLVPLHRGAVCALSFCLDCRWTFPSEPQRFQKPPPSRNLADDPA